MREEDLAVGGAYVNKKTGNVYRISGFSRDSEGDHKKRVLYSRSDGSEEGQLPWDRSLDLFLEKFTIWTPGS